MTTTTTPLTLQQMFTAMVTGLAAQGWEPALERPNPHNPEQYRCLYRTDNKKCAVGQILPDTMYDEKRNRDSLRELLRNIPAFRALVGVEVSDTLDIDEESEAFCFLSDAQTAHDGDGLVAATPQTMPLRFAMLGADYGLTWPETVPYPVGA